MSLAELIDQLDLLTMLGSGEDPEWSLESISVKPLENKMPKNEVPMALPPSSNRLQYEL
jgi:hypothetical protein